MHLRNHPAFHVLATTIQEASSAKEFDFYPNPGNWGDALINAGTIQFFEHYNFSYRSLEREQLSSLNDKELPSLAVVGGGGGWCRNWSSTPKFLSSVAAKYEEVILLPTTFDPEIPFLDLSNVKSFSRDKNIAGPFQIYCPDMAFYFDFQGEEPNISYPLIAFRRDKERNVDSIATYRNFDLSLLGTAKNSPEPFVEIISHFQEIYTDRLHIAIAASMLGRQVNILEGNYGKNRGVFEATIKPNCPNTDFISWQQFRKKNISGMRPNG